jgi:hypothetical protein
VEDEAEPGLQNEIMESFVSENDSQYMGGQSEFKKTKKGGKSSEKGGSGGKSWISRIFGGGKYRTGDEYDILVQKWREKSPEEKKERCKDLWDKARRYNNKLRIQAKL